MGVTATATLLLRARTATTATIRMLARLMDTTDRVGSTAASLSGPAPGIAATDMDTAACTGIAAVTAMGVPVMAMDDLVTVMAAAIAERTRLEVDLPGVATTAT